VVGAVRTGGGNHGRPVAGYVGYGHGFRSDEPHRRADGWRHDRVNGFNAGGDSGDLRVGQAVAAGARAGELGTSFPAVTLR